MADLPCCAVHHVNLTLQCSFVKNNSHCQDIDGFLNYLDFVYCDFAASLVPVIVCVTWMIILFVTLGTTADDFFCPSLEVISKALKLSQNVAGVTFLAFGNGAPDIFSSIAGMNQMRPELVIGSLFGAGIFVTTVVAGSIILVKPFKMMERPFLRDVVFYLGATFWTFYLFYTQSVKLYHAIGFIVLYVIYMIVVLVGHQVYQKCLKPRTLVPALTVETIITSAAVASGNNILPVIEDAEQVTDEIAPWGGPPIVRRWSRDSARLDYSINSYHKQNESLLEDDETLPLIASNSGDQFSCTEWKHFLRAICPIGIGKWRTKNLFQKLFLILKSPLVIVLKLTIPVVDYDKPRRNWCRSLAMVHCVTSPLFFIFSVQYGLVEISGIIPVWTVVLFAGFLLAAITLGSTSVDKPPRYHAAFAFLGFVSSVVWIYLIANEIVSVLKTIGIVAHLSDSILGLTVLAWGNSLGDLIADIAIARQGSPRMGISACFGGPLFNLLMGIGIPFTIKTLEEPSKAVSVIYSRANTVLFSFLCASLISSLIFIPLMRFQTKRLYGVYLIVVYICFLVVSILNEMTLL